MKALLDAKLADDNAERVRKSHADAIRELQIVPVLAARVVKDVALPDATEVDVPHGLGRRPQFMTLSPVRGAPAFVGLIKEIRGTHAAGSSIDAEKFVCLLASGYGATVTVDVMLW